MTFTMRWTSSTGLCTKSRVRSKELLPSCKTFEKIPQDARVLNIYRITNGNIGDCWIFQNIYVDGIYEIYTVSSHLKVCSTSHSSLQHSATIGRDGSAVDMRRSSARQENNQSSNILRLSQLAIRIVCCESVRTTLDLNQPICHLRRVETRCDSVGDDTAWSEGNGKVLREMDGCSLGDRVTESGIVAHASDANSGNGGGDNDAGGVLACATGFKEWSES